MCFLDQEQLLRLPVHWPFSAVRASRAFGRIEDGDTDKGMPVWGEILDAKTIDLIYAKIGTEQARVALLASSRARLSGSLPNSCALAKFATIVSADANGESIGERCCSEDPEGHMTGRPDEASWSTKGRPVRWTSRPKT